MGLNVQQENVSLGEMPVRKLYGEKGETESH